MSYSPHRQRNQRYGIGYQGSKNDIAPWVIDHIPPCDTFIDAFAGGCSIAHAAIESGKYKHVVINDINDTPQLFYDAIQGKYHDEKRWISREEFEAKKDTDVFIRTCWSFGNNGSCYLYGRHLEDYKKGFHYASCFEDYTLWDAMGIVIPAAVRAEGHGLYYQDRRRVLRRWVMANVDVVKQALQEHDYVSAEHAAKISTRSLCNLQNLERLQNLEGLQRLQNLERLSNLERLERLQNLERLEDLPSYRRCEVTILQGDYQDIPIPAASCAIYCDPPYANTDCGQYGGFDHERFCRWLRTINRPVYISEYTMPDDFIAIDAIRKMVRSSGAGKSTGNANIYSEERLFMHQSQQHNYTPTTLFA